MALVIAVVRKLWFALVPGAEPSGPAFAPPARRAADGSAPVSSPVAPGAPAASALALALGAAAITVAGYAAVVAVLRATGAATTMPDAAISWLSRDLVLGGAGTLLVVLAAVSYRGGRPTGSRAPVLFAAGATYFALGVLDMHVFGLLHVGGASHHAMGESALADLLFHGPGVLAMIFAAGSFAAHARSLAADSPRALAASR